MKNKKVLSPDLFTSIGQKKLKDAFYEALKQLTPVQVDAVQDIEGPVMVLAGPGTGKTQVLAARYGYILDTTDIAIPQILCLTYTDAGVHAMRQRLLQFIGPAGHEAHIYTYHSFCQKVINENQEYFFDFKKFRLATDLQRYELIEQILLELPDDNLVKRIIGEKHFDIKRLDRQYDVIKKEQHVVDAMVQFTLNYIDSMDTNTIYLKQNGSGFKADYSKDKGKFKRAIDALMTYHAYETKMKENQWIDFNDILIEVKNAFAKYPDLLARYQEQYQYFLIDEFQDTNTIQLHIVTELCKYWPDPNLFIVGDDDQAIYRFQGANEQNLVSIFEIYPKMELYCIAESFRSTQNILNAANHVIEQLPLRFQNFFPQIPAEIIAKINKKLIASGEHENNQDPIIRSFINAHHEILAVYDYIKKKYDNGEDLSEVAIICRRFKLIDPLLSLLELDGIPISLKTGKDILEQPFVRHFILLMRYLDAELHEKYSGEYMLISLMLLPYWGLNLDDVSLISFLERKNRDRKFLIDKMLDENAWPEAKFNDRGLLKQFALKLQDWKKELPPTKTLSTVVDELFRDSGLLSWALRSKDNTWHLRCYNTLALSIRAASIKSPDITLHQYLQVLHKMSNFEIPIQIEAGYKDLKGVNILSAHGAKGQEYDHVWIINAQKNEWENFGSQEQPYKLPPGIRMHLDQLRENKPYDERRLFYVAMTRARKTLTISWPAKNDQFGAKDAYPSIFVDNLINHLGIRVLPETVNQDLLIQKMTSIENKKNTPSDIINHKLIDDFCERFVMNPTDLNTYLDCPRKFYFEQILKVPRSDNAHLGLGNSIHDALHEYFTNTLKNKEQDPEQLVEYFIHALKRNEWYFTKEEFNGLIRKFSKQLPLFLYQNTPLWKDLKSYKLEYFIDNVQLNGIPINGKIDQVLFTEKEAIIIDFKAGQGDSSSSMDKVKAYRSDKSNTHIRGSGGDYFRQCLFYKILLDLDTSSSVKASKGLVLFMQTNKLDPEKFEFREYVYKKDDLLIFANEIEDTHAKIMNHEFDTGCEENDCDWCNYIKDRERIKE